MNSTLIDALPRPVGFVFGGGGSLGAMQVGKLQAVSEHGIHAGVVTGTSIGAINGAIVASEPIAAANRLSHIWSEITTRSLLPGGLGRRLWTLLRGKNHFLEARAIDALFEREIGDILIEDLAVPFAAMALDVRTGTAETLRTGRLSTALRASSAIPGVFAPVERDGRQLYDGGMVTNLPVREAVALGARSLVVFDCSFEHGEMEPPATLADALYYALSVQLEQQAARDLPLVAESIPVVRIPGPAPRRLSPLDFDQTNELIRSAYDVTRPFLETLQIDGPGLYGWDPTPTDHAEPTHIAGDRMTPEERSVVDLVAEISDEQTHSMTAITVAVRALIHQLRDPSASDDLVPTLELVYAESEVALRQAQRLHEEILRIKIDR